MNFVINTPLSSLTTNKDLTVYINQLAAQKQPVVLRLEVDADQVANVKSITENAAISVEVVVAGQSSPINGDYLLNLRITDKLFPGALAQLAAVLSAHPTDFVTSYFLKADQNLGHSLTDFFTDQYNLGRLTSLPPVQEAGLVDKPLSTWSLADKLAMLPVFQRYLVFTKNDRFLELDNRLWPFGNALKISSLNFNLPLTSVSQQIHVLQNTEDVIFLGAPILASDRRIIDPQNRINELLAAIKVSQTIAFKEQYHPYVIHELQVAVESPAFKALTSELQNKLKKQIKTDLSATDGYSASEVK
ncbi:hypothetical protein OXT66_01655 [Lentilactobacillus senioris]|uniref:hypothetical protein n=1 Tax=Lentilactobacillus senioris TaxID=931534 RepID=UPI002282D797|nr:hypothetical protein [Lentilactobacillus senioris]MCY9806250.1 hypothetical protein [Lentilactobacillus senioris]